MINRLFKFPQKSSFFLFGPRGSGKTFLLKNYFSNLPCLYLDLLDPQTFQNLSLRPHDLNAQLNALPEQVRWIIIDEVQKLPVLLDIVHQQIEKGRFYFALTGSSARKLRHGAANLLAGRAFVYYLYPFTSREIGSSFRLDNALQWGTLPRVFALESDEEKIDFLRSYSHTYLQEEISQEQVVRRLDPFRRFLFIAAQMNGNIINYARIARESGTSIPTVQSYFQILEDTLVGFLLESFHESVRKRQCANPKFYFFDAGVVHSLSQTLQVKLVPQTYAYGNTFEHFLINEISRLQSYARKDFRLSYLRTKDDVEIDLVIERPAGKNILIEIKSTQQIQPEDIASFGRLASDVRNSEAYCFSQDPVIKLINGVRCVPWQTGLEEIGL